MNNQDHLWSALADSQIGTLDDLVHRMAQHQALVAGDAMLVSSSETEPAPPEGVLTQPRIVHRCPKVPLILDGQPLADPNEITAYNGRPLFYTPLRGDSGVALAAFTSREQMLAEARHLTTRYAALLMQSQFDHACVSNPDSLPEQACFFQHINEGGDIKCLAPARAYRDLTRVGRDKVLWWYNSDWNDVISSVSWCRWDVSLYEHINYGGSQLWIPAGCNTPNLVDLGWNDRASAIVNWGRRF